MVESHIFWLSSVKQISIFPMSRKIQTAPVNRSRYSVSDFLRKKFLYVSTVGIFISSSYAEYIFTIIVNLSLRVVLFYLFSFVNSA